MKPSELFCFKDTKHFAALLFFLAACDKKFQRANATDSRMKKIHPMIGWRRDEHGAHKHIYGSWILRSVSRVRSKTMHSLSCITSWLPYITLRYIDSRFFSAPETIAHGSISCRLLAASRLREAARWQRQIKRKLSNMFKNGVNRKLDSKSLYACVGIEVLPGTNGDKPGNNYLRSVLPSIPALFPKIPSWSFFWVQFMLCTFRK